MSCFSALLEVAIIPVLTVLLLPTRINAVVKGIAGQHIPLKGIIQFLVGVILLVGAVPVPPAGPPRSIGPVSALVPFQEEAKDTFLESQNEPDGPVSQESSPSFSEELKREIEQENHCSVTFLPTRDFGPQRQEYKNHLKSGPQISVLLSLLSFRRKISSSSADSDPFFD